MLNRQITINRAEDPGYDRSIRRRLKDALDCSCVWAGSLGIGHCTCCCGRRYATFLGAPVGDHDLRRSRIRSGGGHRLHMARRQRLHAAHVDEGGSWSREAERQDNRVAPRSRCGGGVPLHFPPVERRRDGRVDRGQRKGGHARSGARRNHRYAYADRIWPQPLLARPSQLRIMTPPGHPETGSPRRDSRPIGPASTPWRTFMPRASGTTASHVPSRSLRRLNDAPRRSRPPRSSR